MRLFPMSRGKIPGFEVAAEGGKVRLTESIAIAVVSFLPFSLLLFLACVYLLPGRAKVCVCVCVRLRGKGKGGRGRGEGIWEGRWKMEYSIYTEM